MTNENESSTDSGSQNWNGTGGDNTPEKRNKSNWAKREESWKTKIRATEDTYEQKLAAMRAKLEESGIEIDEEDDEPIISTPSRKSAPAEFDSVEVRLFRAENDDARQYSIDDFREMSEEYPWLSPEKLFRLLKAEKPKSSSNKGLDLGWSVPSGAVRTSKKMEDMSEDEIQALPVKQRLEWRKLHSKRK